MRNSVPMHGINTDKTVVYSCDSPQAVKITYIPLLSTTHSNYRKDGSDILYPSQTTSVLNCFIQDCEGWMEIKCQAGKWKPQDTLPLSPMGLLSITAVDTLFMKKSYINHL